MGCGFVTEQAARLVPHYRDLHPEEYARRKAERAAKRAARGEVEPEVEERASEAERETQLLTETSAWFDAVDLPSTACDRVLSYLRARYGTPTTPPRFIGYAQAQNGGIDTGLAFTTAAGQMNGLGGQVLG
jgi:hypothetical protein